MTRLNLYMKNAFGGCQKYFFDRMALRSVGADCGGFARRLNGKLVFASSAVINGTSENSLYSADHEHAIILYVKSYRDSSGGVMMVGRLIRL